MLYEDKIDYLEGFMKEVDLAIATHFKRPKSAYMITGGALRDSLLGVPVKDIDIVTANIDCWNIPSETEIVSVDSYGTVKDLNISVRGCPLQLIERNDFSFLGCIEHHSLSLSNIFWFQGQLFIHSSWLKDVRDKTHTINRKRHPKDSETLTKYLDKITKKYPWRTR